MAERRTFEVAAMKLGSNFLTLQAFSDTSRGPMENQKVFIGALLLTLLVATGKQRIALNVDK